MHASLILVGYHPPGICITPLLNNHHCRQERQDGVESVKPTNRRGHITAEFVEGDRVYHLSQTMPTSDTGLQMYTQDGSPLPMDYQLYFSSYLSSFPPLPLLCDGIHDTP